MWSISRFLFIVIYRSDLPPVLYCSYENGTYRCKIAERCVGYFLTPGHFDADCSILQVISLSLFHEFSVVLSSSRPVVVRWNYFQSWQPPLA